MKTRRKLVFLACLTLAAFVSTLWNPGAYAPRRYGGTDPELCRPVCGQTAEEAHAVHAALAERGASPVWTRLAQEALAAANLGKRIDVPYISQLPLYPNGCEAVSAVMLLRYWDIPMSVDTFIDDYLPRGDRPVVGVEGPDPAEVYCGDPRSEDGWGCYAPAVAAGLRQCVPRGLYRIALPRASSLAELCEEYIDNDIPVIVWGTLDMYDGEGADECLYWWTPEGKEIAYNRKLHCLVLCGYDGENYLFNDPLAEGKDGWIAYPRQRAENAFLLLGSQSVAIAPRARRQKNGSEEQTIMEQQGRI